VVIWNSTTGTDPDESKQSEGAKRGAKSTKARTSIKTEILFLERIYQFLKPSGRAVVVVPDGILTNSSLQGVRNWMMDHFQIMAVVSLPQFAFSHYDAGVKASMLFLRRRDDNEVADNEEAIFMAQAENIGYDATGRDTFVKTLEKETLQERVEIWRCDLFDYRVTFEWTTADPKEPHWSERGRAVIRNSGLLGQYQNFLRDPHPFFV
jgi:type I restriction enzyme M protein